MTDKPRVLPDGVTVDDVRAFVALLVETGGKCQAPFRRLRCDLPIAHRGSHVADFGRWSKDSPSPWTPRMIELLETLGGTG